MTKFRAKKILVPVDFSAFSEGALETAADLAQTQDGELTLLHVMMEPRASVPYEVYIDWQKVKDEIWRDVEKSLETMKEKKRFRGQGPARALLGRPARGDCEVCE
ncbi:MAG: universal stress protein [Nitrospinota bacterium]